MFCKVKGTLDDPSSFILTGVSDLDNILWDDERFNKISDSTAAMTKDECEAFISEHQNGTSQSVSDGEATGSNVATEYTSSFNVEELSVEFIDFNGFSLPVPSELDLYSSTDDVVMYTGTNKAFAIGYVPTSGYSLSSEDLDECGESFINGFLESVGNGAVNSESDVLVSGHPAKEYTATTTVNGTVLTAQSIVIDYSADGFVIVVLTGYNAINSEMLDYYHYTISVLQSGDASAAATTTADTTQETTSGSSSVRETLDEYEAFMNEYIAFMQTYNNASPDQAIAMMDDYLELLDQYTEVMESINNIDTSSMTAEDYAYYIEVTTRVSQNLLSIY
jgi:hypothetical protein